MTDDRTTERDVSTDRRDPTLLIDTPPHPGVTIPEEYRGIAVPGYELLTMLGRGGMAVVFLARQQRLDRLVAVKMLQHEDADDTDYISRLQREAVVMGSLSHPNIVGCHDFLHNEHGMFVVMEHIPGGMSVRDVVRRNGRLPEDLAVRIVLDAARGLEYAHEKDIIHRDIKPDNLLVYYDQGEPPQDPYELFRGPNVRAMIADFGLAKTGRPLPDEREATAYGRIMGSPAYMAPEQALGRPVDFRADMYALGATFYHLLTGEPPFSADTPMGTINLKLSNDLPDPRKHDADLSPAGLGILRRLTQRLSDDRYADYPSLTADLDRLAAPASTGTAARRSGPGRTPPPRTPAGAWAAVGLLAALLAAGMFVLHGAGRPPQLLSQELEHWDGDTTAWSLEQPDDESPGELSLIGRGRQASLILRKSLRPGTHILAQVRLPNPGTVGLGVLDGTQLRWLFEWTRTETGNSYRCVADSEERALPELEERKTYEWHHLDIQVFKNHIVLFVGDEQDKNKKLVSQAIWETDVDRFRPVLLADTDWEVQFKDVRVEPVLLPDA